MACQFHRGAKLRLNRSLISLLTYQTLTNDAGDASFKFLVNEGGQSTGNEVTLTLDVTAVDDQPVNTVPGQSIEVDEKDYRGD